jgi:hypothetical protein
MMALPKVTLVKRCESVTVIGIETYPLFFGTPEIIPDGESVKRVVADRGQGHRTVGVEPVSRLTWRPLPSRRNERT